jgi:hypothetical protein
VCIELEHGFVASFCKPVDRRGFKFVRFRACQSAQCKTFHTQHFAENMNDTPVNFDFAFTAPACVISPLDNPEYHSSALPLQPASPPATVRPDRFWGKL